jgi:hypothetical protein
MTGDLAAFLAARLDEDEAAAQAAASVAGPDWHHALDDDGLGYTVRLLSAAGSRLADTHRNDEEIAPHLARYDPARVLLGVAAKRAILAEHVNAQDLGAPIPAVCNRCTTDEVQIRFFSPTECLPWPCPTVRALAAVYSDHPDYRQEWAP